MADSSRASFSTPQPSRAQRPNARNLSAQQSHTRRRTHASMAVCLQRGESLLDSTGQPSPEMTDEDLEAMRFEPLQNFTAIVNNPKENWFADVMDALDSSWTDPSNANQRGTVIDRANFSKYLSNVGAPYKKFRRHVEYGAGDDDKDLEQADAVLASMPPMFFREDFRLEDPVTFDQLYPSEQTETLVLQEQLSHYLDMVELSLLQQVSDRADHFFTALHTLQDVHWEVTGTVDTIGTMREDLNTINQNAVVQPLKVAAVCRRRANAVQLYQKIQLMATVRQTQPTIQLLLRSSDFSGALDLISSTQHVLGEELADVACLKDLNSQLEEMVHLIRKMMSSDFVDKATASLDFGCTANPVAVFKDSQEELVPIILGLLRIGKFGDVMAMYREKMSRTIRDNIKEALKSALPSGELDAEEEPAAPTNGEAGVTNGDASAPKENKQLSLAEKLRALDHSAFAAALGKIFDVVSCVLVRANAIDGLLMSVVESATENCSQLGDYDQPSSEESDKGGSSKCGGQNVVLKLCTLLTSDYRKRLQQDSLQLMAHLCELAHSRCAKLLNLRSSVSAKLPLRSFVELFEMVLRFIVVGESESKSSCLVLRGALLSQGKTFLEAFHKNKIGHLTLLLEQETWSQADVPVEFQSLVDSFGKVTKGFCDYDFDEEEEEISLEDSAAGSNDAVASSKEDGKDKKPVDRRVKVDLQRFCVAGSVLMVFRILNGYLEVSNAIPALTTSIVQKVVEVLMMYNSKTCQLVLGAGAMHLAGLKSITAKHLALASQCLSLILVQTPKACDALAKNIPANQQNLLNDFNRVTKDYQAHKEEIFQKLVSIMRDMLDGCCNNMAALEWDSENAPTPSKYTKDIIRKTMQLQKVLQPILPGPDLDYIFTKVSAVYNEHLIDHYRSLQLPNPVGRKRLHADVRYLAESLKKLRMKPGGALEEFAKQHFGIG